MALAVAFVMEAVEWNEQEEKDEEQEGKDEEKKEGWKVHSSEAVVAWCQSHRLLPEENAPAAVQQTFLLEREEETLRMMKEERGMRAREKRQAAVAERSEGVARARMAHELWLRW